MEVLKKHKATIGWHIFYLKGIDPSYCMHKINMEADYKSVRQPQRRLNLVMKEEVQKEVLKLLEAGLIYPISDSVHGLALYRWFQKRRHDGNSNCE